MTIIFDSKKKLKDTSFNFTAGSIKNQMQSVTCG